MLGQRRRRWLGIDPTLAQRPVLSSSHSVALMLRQRCAGDRCRHVGVPRKSINKIYLPIIEGFPCAIRGGDCYRPTPLGGACCRWRHGASRLDRGLSSRELSRDGRDFINRDHNVGSAVNMDKILAFAVFLEKRFIYNFRNCSIARLVQCCRSYVHVYGYNFNVVTKFNITPFGAGALYVKI